MMNAPRRVRVGAVYRFEACGFDRFHPHGGTPANGATVRVIDRHGCPPANTMGHCYVESLDGCFLGLVQTASLTRACPRALGGPDGPSPQRKTAND